MESASIPARPSRARGEVVARVHLQVRPDRDPADPPRRLRDPGPAGRGRPGTARHQHQGRPLQRRHLGADRRRLHARLRHHRADQLRPRRPVHARQLRRLRDDRDHRPHDRHRRAPADLRPAADPADRDGRLRNAQHDDRAGGLQAVAQRAEAGAADHGGGLLVHPAERRPAVARRLAPRRARPDRVPGATRDDPRRPDHPRRPARPGRDRAAVLLPA